jgi:hypothetical protein
VRLRDWNRYVSPRYQHPTGICARCDDMFAVHPESDWTPICDSCAQELVAVEVPKLLATIRRLRAAARP